LQNLDISINEWAVVFFLTEVECSVIWGSHFGWSFHVGCPFSCLFAEDGYGWVELEIDFAAENEKMSAINRGNIQ
jgi:hypothetical protein